MNSLETTTAFCSFLGESYHLSDVKLTRIWEGAINRSYRLKSLERILFLRIYENETYLGKKTRSHIEEELRFLELLQQDQLNTPIPVFDRDGCALQQLDGEHFVLFEFIDGVHPVGKLNKEYSYKIGEEVGKLHSIIIKSRLSTQRGWFGKTFIEHAIEKLKGSDLTTEEVEENKALQTLANTLDNKLKRNLFRIHGDLHLGNILIANSKAFIIDFDSIQKGHLEQDIANHIVMTVFKAVLTGNNYTMTERDVISFLQGYKSTLKEYNLDMVMTLFYCRVIRLLLLADYKPKMEKEMLSDFSARSKPIINYSVFSNDN